MMHLECFMSLGACAQNLSDYPEVIIHVDLCCFWFRLSKGNLNLFFLASLPFVKKIIKKKYNTYHISGNSMLFFSEPLPLRSFTLV